MLLAKCYEHFSIHSKRLGGKCSRYFFASFFSTPYFVLWLLFCKVNKNAWGKVDFCSRTWRSGQWLWAWPQGLTQTHTRLCCLQEWWKTFVWQSKLGAGNALKFGMKQFIQLGSSKKSASEVQSSSHRWTLAALVENCWSHAKFKTVARTKFYFFDYLTLTRKKISVTIVFCTSNGSEFGGRKSVFSRQEQKRLLSSSVKQVQVNKMQWGWIMTFSARKNRLEGCTWIKSPSLMCNIQISNLSAGLDHKCETSRATKILL